MQTIDTCTANGSANVGYTWGQCYTVILCISVHILGGRLQHNGPNATPPQLSVKTCGGRGGGQLGCGGGYYSSAGGGAARNPVLPHAYLKGVCVSKGMGV